jgi:hypothetical protein
MKETCSVFADPRTDLVLVLESREQKELRKLLQWALDKYPEASRDLEEIMRQMNSGGELADAQGAPWLAN